MGLSKIFHRTSKPESRNGAAPIVDDDKALKLGRVFLNAIKDMVEEALQRQREADNKNESAADDEKVDETGASPKK